MTEARELIIDVKGMTCDHCERSVAKALRTVPGVHQVLEVSHAAAMARVMAAPEATAERIERAVEKAGYRARVKAGRREGGVSCARERAVQRVRRAGWDYTTWR